MIPIRSTKPFQRTYRMTEIIVKGRRSQAASPVIVPDGKNGSLRETYRKNVLDKIIEIEEVCEFIKSQDHLNYQLTKSALEEIASSLGVGCVREYDAKIDGRETDRNRLYFWVSEKYHALSVSVHLPLFDQGKFYSVQIKSPSIFPDVERYKEEIKERYDEGMVCRRFEGISKDLGVQHDGIAYVPHPAGNEKVPCLSKEARYSYHIADLLDIGNNGANNNTPTKERLRINLEMVKQRIKNVNEAYHAFCEELQARVCLSTALPVRYFKGKH